MRRARACASLLLVLALGGCGGARKTIETASPGRPSVANLCFVLKARLEGIEHTAAMNSPEPAALAGRLPAERVSRASTEAIGVTRKTVSELAGEDAPPGSLGAMRAAERDYGRLARGLRDASAPSGAAGLRMQASFLRVAGTELRGCLPPG